MFIFDTPSNLLHMQNMTSSDITIFINNEIIGKNKLITTIYQGIKSDYTDNCWEGLYDALSDLIWIPGKWIHIVHLSLPVINDYEMRVYLDVLESAVNAWLNPDKDGRRLPSDGSQGLRIYFCDTLKESVEYFLTINP